jgi:hypothetical protein
MAPQGTSGASRRAAPAWVSAARCILPPPLHSLRWILRLTSRHGGETPLLPSGCPRRSQAREFCAVPRTGSPTDPSARLDESRTIRRPTIVPSRRTHRGSQRGVSRSEIYSFRLDDRVFIRRPAIQRSRRTPPLSLRDISPEGEGWTAAFRTGTVGSRATPRRAGAFRTGTAGSRCASRRAGAFRTGLMGSRGTHPNRSLGGAPGEAG